tara:strand:- start:284295 stop:285467 length:1173 start_codon:yes stop_codon:yes gene_type:complete
MIEKICKDPFKLFFPIAIISMLYSCCLWLGYVFFEVGGFPLSQHANLFIGGFLYFSIIGFLLTAVPRFTGTDFLSKQELSVFIFITLCVLIFYFLGNLTFFWASIASGWVMFLCFAVPRFLFRKQNPPYTFVFVGCGVIFGLLGSFINFLSEFEMGIFGALRPWGKLLFYDAMVTSFILGVGGRLIPGILGFVEIVSGQRKVYEKTLPFLSVIPIDIIVSLIVFVASLIIEGAGALMVAFFLRATVITYFSIKYWRLHEKVKSEKWHGKMLKLSCFMLLVGSWTLCFSVEQAIHIKHLIYIGSYCLMTLMVASRVIVAHSDESLDIEFKKWPYLLVGLFVVLAALTRASAHLIKGSYVQHLGYAALVLIIGALVWAGVYMKKMYTPTPKN